MSEAEQERAAAFREAAKLLKPFEPALATELVMGCLDLHPGEPFFVLRAQDITAPAAVEEWIRMNAPSAGELKIDGARAVVDRMRRWSGPRKNAD